MIRVAQGEREELNMKLRKGTDVNILATCQECLHPKNEQSQPFIVQDIMDFLTGLRK